MSDIPKITKTSEIGENAFRVVKVEETILQGWDAGQRRMLYLFKNNQTNNWAYYDKDRKQTFDVLDWRDKEAFIMGKYVKMSLYYRVHLVFDIPIEYGVAGKKQMTYEALVLLAKTAYEALQQQMVGRDLNSFFKFEYKKLAKGLSVSKVIFVK